VTGATNGGCVLRFTNDERGVAMRGAGAANALTAGKTGRFYPHATRIRSIATRDARGRARTPRARRCTQAVQQSRCVDARGALAEAVRR
jgi:hypothetical protein